jgi:hypothetical protein
MKIMEMKITSPEQYCRLQSITGKEDNLSPPMNIPPLKKYRQSGTHIKTGPFVRAERCKGRKV